jgi:TatD DNase family protein
MYMFTDTHCHLDFQDFDPDRDQVLERAWEAGVEHVLNPGIDILTSQVAVQLSKTYRKVFAAVGIHPNSSQSWDAGTLDILEYLATRPQVVAIGEIGLDYYRDRAPLSHQKQVLIAQLGLAERLNLPVVIHTRNKDLKERACITDLIAILSEWKTNLAHPGVVHSYSGNEIEAQQILALGFYIGITGPVTYRNADTLREVVASIPLDRLLIETDGPFLTPHPYRGKRNEPANVRYIAEKISEVHQQPLKVVAEQTTKNARALFQWDK